MNISAFHTLPLLGIMRGITKQMVDPIANIVISTGLRSVEITMNTPNVNELIGAMQKASNGRFDVGAGTVLNLNDLNVALSAGASFIVSPNVNPQVIEYCAKKSIPVFPGALTPTEVYNAWDAGATMVKLFPSNAFGASYIKDLKGPLDKVKILACGGVSKDTIAEYFEYGASAIAFGSSIFNLDLLKKGDYEEVSNRLSSLISAFKSIDSQSIISY